MVEESIDPRILRTQQMLYDALGRLLEAKSIDKISVAEIAEEAALNRATFYDHYADKFDLLEGMVGSRFRQLLEKRGVVFDGTCGNALANITLATCDYLAGLPGPECPERRQMEKHFEAAIASVVRATILQGVKAHSKRDPAASPELIAAAVSGAICGAAKEWVHTPGRVPVDEAVGRIVKLAAPIFPDH